MPPKRKSTSNAKQKIKIIRGSPRTAKNCDDESVEKNDDETEEAAAQLIEGEMPKKLEANSAETSFFKEEMEVDVKQEPVDEKKSDRNIMTVPAEIRARDTLSMKKAIDEHRLKAYEKKGEYLFAKFLQESGLTSVILEMQSFQDLIHHLNPTAKITGMPVKLRSEQNASPSDYSHEGNPIRREFVNEHFEESENSEEKLEQNSYQLFEEHHDIQLDSDVKIEEINRPSSCDNALFEIGAARDEYPDFREMGSISPSSPCDSIPSSPVILPYRRIQPKPTGPIVQGVIARLRSRAAAAYENAIVLQQNSLPVQQKSSFTYRAGAIGEQRTGSPQQNLNAPVFKQKRVLPQTRIESDGHKTTLSEKLRTTDQNGDEYHTTAGTSISTASTSEDLSVSKQYSDDGETIATSETDFTERTSNVAPVSTPSSNHLAPCIICNLPVATQASILLNGNEAVKILMAAVIFGARQMQDAQRIIQTHPLRMCTLHVDFAYEMMCFATGATTVREVESAPIGKLLKCLQIYRALKKLRDAQEGKVSCNTPLGSFRMSVKAFFRNYIPRNCDNPMKKYAPPSKVKELMKNYAPSTSLREFLQDENLQLTPNDESELVRIINGPERKSTSRKRFEPGAFDMAYDSHEPYSKYVKEDHSGEGPSTSSSSPSPRSHFTGHQDLLYKSQLERRTSARDQRYKYYPYELRELMRPIDKQYEEGTARNRHEMVQIRQQKRSNHQMNEMECAESSSSSAAQNQRTDYARMVRRVMENHTKKPHQSQYDTTSRYSHFSGPSTSSQCATSSTSPDNYSPQASPPSIPQIHVIDGKKYMRVVPKPGFGPPGVIQKGKFILRPNLLRDVLSSGANHQKPTPSLISNRESMNLTNEKKPDLGDKKLHEMSEKSSTFRGERISAPVVKKHIIQKISQMDIEQMNSEEQKPDTLLKEPKQESV